MESVALHTIKAYLYDNALTKDDVNDYVARTCDDAAHERAILHRMYV